MRVGRGPLAPHEPPLPGNPKEVQISSSSCQFLARQCKLCSAPGLSAGLLRISCLPSPLTPQQAQVRSLPPPSSLTATLIPGIQAGRKSGRRETCESPGAASRQVIHTSHVGQTLKLPTAPRAALSRPRYGGRFGQAESQHRSPSPHPRTWGNWSERGRGRSVGAWGRPRRQSPPAHCSQC